MGTDFYSFSFLVLRPHEKDLISTLVFLEAKQKGPYYVLVLLEAKNNETIMSYCYLSCF